MANQMNHGRHARTSTAGTGVQSRNATNYYRAHDAYDYRPQRYVGRRKKRSNPVKRIVIAVLTICVCYLLALGVSGMLMYKSSDGLRADASHLQHALLDGDYNASQTSANAISSKVGTLNKHLSSPLWAPATVLPYIGRDVANARTICSAANNVCNELLVPMVESLVSSNPGAIIGEDSSLNADALQVCLLSLGNASDTMALEYTHIEDLQKGRITKLDAAIKKLTKAFKAVKEVSAVAPQLAERIHWMLGADGQQRTYLVAAQNNVEIRATGGYPGSLGQLYIRDGKMDMGDFISGAGVGRFDGLGQPVAEGDPEPPEITAEENMIFGKRVSVIPCDMNYIPSFARASELWQYVWTVAGGGRIDGVIGIDPVFLQRMLRLFDDLVASDGTIVNGNNAATLLMYDTYRTRTPVDQDAFFAEVAKLAFHEVTHSFRKVNMLQFCNNAWKMGADGRLQFWFDDEVSQRAFKTLGLTGEIPDSVTEPTLGVYVNDDTWSKMFWYLSVSTKIGKAHKNIDGTYTYQVTTTFKNNLTEEEELALPDYVIGHNGWCRSRGDMIAWIYLVAPSEGSISDVSATGFFTDPSKVTFENYGRISVAGMNEATYEGRNMWYGLTQLNRGESTIITYTVTTSSDASSADLRLDTTPTAQSVAGW